MDVFIAWSGERSRAIARALVQWLRVVVQHAKPWMSDADIDLGKRWNVELARRLAASEFGIACVTPENTGSPWLHFEAGAIAKDLEVGRVVPLLFDMTPADLAPPLSQFQAAETNKDGLLRLVLAIAGALPSGTVSRETTTRAFESNWPWFQEQLQAIPRLASASNGPDSNVLLQEILAIARRLDQADQSGRLTSEPPDVAETLQAQITAVEAELAGYDSMIRFYSEGGSSVPEAVEERHRDLRYRRRDLTDAFSAVKERRANRGML